MSKKVKSSDTVTDILIVEDSPTQAAQIKYLLESHNYKTEVAQNGQQALVWLSKHKPSLIISDIVMPEMNGFELCEKTKSEERTKDIPVILLTSLTDSDEVIEGLSCGADSFITKPYNKEYLISNIEKILSEKATPESKREVLDIEISFSGKKKQIRTEPKKIIKLLLNIYQGAIHRNNELIQTRDELRLLNERLEELVEERTKEIRKDEKKILAFNAELEQRIQERTAQLEAANKELEAFSYSVSHDLRAPLRHVSGYVELLNKHFQSELPEKGRHYLNSIADSVRVMGVLIDDLLQFSRTGRMEMLESNLDINEIVQEVKESISKENPGRKIEWVLGKLASVYGDEAMLRLVWMNLLSNAVKFTRTRKKARIEIGIRQDDKELVFFVRDNGVGFDMQYAQKLFGVFQRLHSTEEFEGTGIGLANVQRIVSRHGGRVWAEAELDKGAVFYFSLPNR